MSICGDGCCCCCIASGGCSCCCCCITGCCCTCLDIGCWFCIVGDAGADKTKGIEGINGKAGCFTTLIDCIEATAEAEAAATKGEEGRARLHDSSSCRSFSFFCWYSATCLRYFLSSSSACLSYGSLSRTDMVFQRSARVREAAWKTAPLSLSLPALTALSMLASKSGCDSPCSYRAINAGLSCLK